MSGEFIEEARLEDRAARVDAGRALLTAAAGGELDVKFRALDEARLLVHDGDHDVSFMRLCSVYRLGPHVIAFCVFFSFTVWDWHLHETCCGYHIAYLEYERVVAHFVVILRRVDVPFFFQVADELLFVPFVLREQHEADEGPPPFPCAPRRASPAPSSRCVSARPSLSPSRPAVDSSYSSISL